MSPNQLLVFLCAVVVVFRIPRLIERWKAPLLRGEGWFFSVEVPSDFLSGAGGSILRRYRARLFLPWMIETPIAITLALMHNVRYFGILIIVTTLFTRLNCYFSRAAAEREARRFELASPAEPASAISLSLAPRTLRDYTNPWMEAAIAGVILASVAWLGYRYAVFGDSQALRKAVTETVFYLYVQAGMLLVKRGMVRARYAAPAADAAQHLAWRESLRRLSCTLCDFSRLTLAICSAAVALTSAIAADRRVETGVVLALLGLSAVFAGIEWRRRLQYLEVARSTKPAKLLVRPDVPGPLPIVCFQPSLPPLLLSSPDGYAVNLASAPAKAAGLYAAGFALLWAYLTHLSA